MICHIVSTLNEYMNNFFLKSNNYYASRIFGCVVMLEKKPTN